MLARLIYNILKINLKNRYYHFINIFMEFFSIIITLVIYWYTSKAFKFNSEINLIKYKTDYFHFLLIGEIFLSIPLLLLTNFAKKTKMLILDGTFESFLALPIHPLKPIIILSLTEIFGEFVHIIITLACAYLFFELNIHLFNLLYCLILLILTITIFTGFGIILTSLLLIFGRGENLIGYLTTLTAVLSGYFFPIDVFPTKIVLILNYISPFTLFLQTIRSISATGFSEINTIQVISLLSWNLIIIPAIFFYNYAEKNYKKKGSLTIFTY